MSENMMYQYAPFPDDLMWVVENLNFRIKGWTFGLGSCSRDDGEAHGLTLIVTVNSKDFYQERMRNTRHEFIVPAATYNKITWAQWVLDCIHQIGAHEFNEAFVLDGQRPFAPRHGPGFNPYHFVIYNATDEQRRTAPGGEVQPK